MTSIKNIKSVVIVGGGTAGWISACHLAKKLNARTPKIQVMLVESPNIPTIGVGEGTVPMLRETLKYFGIREDEFIRCCDVTFKQSVKFIDWNKPNSGSTITIYLIIPTLKISLQLGSINLFQIEAATLILCQFKVI